MVIVTLLWLYLESAADWSTKYWLIQLLALATNVFNQLCVPVQDMDSVLVSFSSCFWLIIFSDDVLKKRCLHKQRWQKWSTEMLEWKALRGYPTLKWTRGSRVPWEHGLRQSPSRGQIWFVSRMSKSHCWVWFCRCWLQFYRRRHKKNPLCILVLGAFPYRLIWTHSQCCY